MSYAGVEGGGWGGCKVHCCSSFFFFLPEVCLSNIDDTLFARDTESGIGRPLLIVIGMLTGAVVHLSMSLSLLSIASLSLPLSLSASLIYHIYLSLPLSVPPRWPCG